MTKIDVDITQKDLLTFSKFAYSNLAGNKSIWKSMLVNFFLWFFIAATFSIVINQYTAGFPDIHWPSVIGTSTVFLAIAAYAFYESLVARKRSYPKDNGVIIGPRSLEITDDGIRESHSFGHSFHTWQAVDKIVSVNGNIYIFIDRVAAHIIPSRFFLDGSEHDTTLNEIKTLHQKATEAV